VEPKADVATLEGFYELFVVVLMIALVLECFRMGVFIRVVVRRLRRWWVLSERFAWKNAVGSSIPN